VLIRALRFLGQPAPEELQRGGTRAVWDWATRHWQLDRVPQAPVKEVD